VRINWGQTVDSDTVEYRIDGGEVLTAEDWSSSGNHMIGFFSPGNSLDPAYRLVMALDGAETLVVRTVTSALGDRLTATFSLAGYERAVQDVRAACGW
jgi:hypothetical protein